MAKKSDKFASMIFFSVTRQKRIFYLKLQLISYKLKLKNTRVSHTHIYW